MARGGNNYSILVGVELETSNIKKQLDEASKGTKVNVDTKDAKDGIDSLNNSMEDTTLTFQAANEVFSKSIEVISSMVSEVYNLDAALIEFKKISALSGEALDEYVEKLTVMGDTVARTGKPKRQAPDDGMVNQHQEPLEIQYSLRAYSTTMVA